MKTRPIKPEYFELIGKKFNMFTVVKPVRATKKNGNKCIKFLCRCECGSETLQFLHKLRSQRSKSCGCNRIGWLKRDNNIDDHPCSNIYYKMLTRCNSPQCREYYLYGGRGIKVCDRWMKGGFWVFLADMGNRPSKDYSLDRIDNNGDYSPENCRWATRKQQARNMRVNRIIEYKGMKLTLSEWAEKFNIQSGTISSRLDRGWSVDDALEKPLFRSRYQ